MRPMIFLILLFNGLLINLHVYFFLIFLLKINLIASEELTEDLDSFDPPESEVVSTTSKKKGMINIGNNCYINSFVQALYHTAHLRQLVLTETFKGNFTQFF